MDKHFFIPKSVQLELERGAMSESDFLWTIADHAVSVFADCHERREGGEKGYHALTDAEIWSGIGHYCRKSGPRVKKIASIAVFFPPDQRKIIEKEYGKWEFGYHDRLAALPPDQWVHVFEFLRDYLSGKLTDPSPGRRLGVSEFIYIFESHILGKAVNTVEQPDTSIDMESGYSPTIPFQSVLSSCAQLEKQLTPHRDKKSVQKILYHWNAMRREIPKAMVELGFPINVDKDASVSV